MIESLSIALLQLCSSDLWEKNLRQIEDTLSELSDPVDAIVLPENAAYMRVSSKSPAFFAGTEVSVFFQGLADKHQSHVIVGSVPLRSEADPSKATNSTLWFQPDQETREVYNKIHLFDVDVEGEDPVRESDQFVAGNTPSMIDIKGWKWGLSICYDLRFSELFRHYAQQEADVIFVPAAFLQATGQAHWHTLLRARAIESQCFVVAPAQAGRHMGEEGRTRQSFGHSLVVSPWGEVVSDQGPDQVSCHRVVLDPMEIRRVRKQIPMAAHRKTSLC